MIIARIKTPCGHETIVDVSKHDAETWNNSPAWYHIECIGRTVPTAYPVGTTMTIEAEDDS